MSFVRLLAVLSFPVLLTGLSGQTHAEEALSLVPQTWQMLDYMASDYAGSVENGEVTNAAEYAEQQEFSRTARQRIAGLPANEAQPGLTAMADRLIGLIDAKAPAAEVSSRAHQLADALLAAYPVAAAPAKLPDLARGARLYQENCAACHGASGNGKGSQATTLDPPPIDFTNAARADQRSPLSYYQTISQGVTGTSMQAWDKALGEYDRWSLAYFIGALAYSEERQRGAALLGDDAAARAEIGSLAELSRLRAEQLATAMGKDEARALLGYLRANPGELERAPGGIALARGRIEASLRAYQAGDAAAAASLALSAYLDGVEPLEPLLNAHNGKLRMEIELAMGAYRTSLAKKAPIEDVRAQAGRIDLLLAEAAALTDGPSAGALTIFLGAFAILVREGLEALLVLVGLVAFLKKAGRHDTLRWVHAGWMLAVAAGALTWLAARYSIAISGASRELTEGLSSLFAAAMLLFVGLWMHQKSMGDRWQAYIREKTSHALGRKSVWLLFALAFVTVYREMFETILFYVALWREGMGGWILLGMLAAVAALALLAWLMLATSRRLPLSAFFLASSVLIAVLAVALTGKGVSALQEAGWVSVSIADVPHIELLGVYPTWQTSLSQVAVIALLAAGYLWNRRRAAAG